MCTNFGIPFEGKIPDGRKSTSDQRYTVSLVIGSRGHPVAVIHCKDCGQTSRLASNEAVRPIARYFLSLSLPFVDCPNTDCQNHGVNLYEHWPPTGKGRSPYRGMGDHTARCKACDGLARSGGRASSISLGTPRRVVDSPETRNRWRTLLDALPAAHSIAGITGMLGVSYATYHGDLARLGARLNDYHAFRNARLLHPDTPNRDRPISLYTGEMTLPARFSAKRNGAKSLSVIVTVASAGGANFVLAAHPCFLPAVLCPDAATLAADGRRPPLESEWDALQHPFGDGSDRTLDKREDAVPADPIPDAFFVRAPYAALAHFLVVQKMLSRFRVIHNTINAADGLFTAALVAYRDRILAGQPRTAEVVLFSFAPPGGRLKTRPVGPPSAAPEISPDDAWRAAEERFAERPVPAHLEKDGLSWDHPRVTPTTLTINEPEVRMTPRIVASTARATMRESVGDVTVRLRLEHPPENAAETDGYTGCRLRPGSGGDAETPSDATFSGQLDLTSSNGWSAQAALLTVVDDTAREDDETLVVEGYCTGSTSGTDPTHSELESVPLTLTIVDNDDPVIRLSVSPINIFEDAGARVVTITAETDEAPDTAVTVTLILGAGSYSTTGLRYIEIESGNTSGSTDLTFEPEHDGNRTDDSVSIDGSATGYFVIPSALIISDSTTDVPVVVASVENSTLVESTGRVNVRLTLDHPPETEADGGYTGCRLRLGAGGEAETPADVIFSNQKKLSPSNDWSAETQFMRVVDDDTYEGDETLVVEGYCTGTNRGVEPSHTALDFVPLTLTIEDNDLPSISLTTNPRRIGEGGGRQAVTVTAWAEKAPEEDGARVYLDLESGSYTVTGSRSIWIDRSERSGSTTLTFEPADDGNTTDDEIVIDGNASGYRVEATQLTIRDSDNETATPKALVPLFLNATDPFRHGFVRVINRSTAEGEVRLTAIDDAGYQPASVSIRLGAASAIQFNSEDLENGNPEKGLAVGVGQGTGQWRLLFDSELDLGVLAYVRTSDGFLTAVHDVAPLEQGDYRVATFNPGSNVDQVSTLRVVNTSPATASVTVEGYEESGTSSSGVVRFDVPANTVREFTAAELETGAGLASSLGSGTGKWRLAVRSEQSIVVMSLLESPEGYLTNLSSLPALPEGARGVHPVPFFPAASDPSGRQGFVRLISRSPSIGNVSVRAFDRSDTDYAPLTISLDAWETAHFNSDDLELGNASKGLTGSTGSGTGDWRLELTSALNIDALSYVRTTSGFLTSMHDLVPSVQGVYSVATFNPASNLLQVSRLLLINPENRDANVTIEGTDDDGASPGGTVAFTVAAGSTRMLDASQLESGGDDLSGVIGDGTGKWRLSLEADQPILVVNLLSSPTGHISNLSSVPN